METNLSTLDRAWRLALGLLVIALPYAYETAGGVIIDKRVTLLIGIWPIITAVLGHCPIYRLFGYSTCPRG